MDKKKAIVLGVILILVIAAGGWYFAKNKLPGNLTGTVADKAEEVIENGTEQVQQAIDKYSVSDLMARGSDLKCTYSSKTEESGTADITVYISGKRMRADSKGVSAEGIEFESAMILDGGYIYVWQPGMKEGMKMPATDPEANKNNWKGESTYLDPEQKVDYKCGDWAVDAKVFSLPTGVEFSDLSQVFKTQCAVCDNLSGEQKDTCKKSLGCQ